MDSLRRKLRPAAIAAFSLICLFLQAARPQTTIRTEVNLVNLAVNARHIDGGFASDIPKSEFHVYEDGVEQEIALFAQEAVPTHIVLLVDASGSVRFEWGAIKHAAVKFAEQIGPKDRVAVVIFNDELRLVQDWTYDPKDVARALSKVFPKGSTKLYDGIYVVFDDLLRDVEGKKAVIILTDGFDSGSKIRYEQAVELSVRSGALVYVVSEVEAFKAAVEFHERQAGRSSGIRPEDYFWVETSLKRLAYETGGKVLYPDSFGHLGDVYAQVAQELKHQYAIGYIPSNRAKDGKYRRVEVKVDRPGVLVSTRPGYYAPKE